VDEQIAAMQADIGDQEKKVVAAGGVVEKDKFVAHCKPAVKAALEAAPDAAVVEKREDGPFAAQLEATNRKQLIENEEFLLGLLIMHQSRQNWSYEQQMDALCDLAHDSPLITKLYKHHDKTKPLSTQLASMMDEERKNMKPTSEPPMSLGGDSVGKLLSKLTGGKLR